MPAPTSVSWRPRRRSPTRQSTSRTIIRAPAGVRTNPFASTSAGHETWPPQFNRCSSPSFTHTAGRNNDPNPAATIRGDLLGQDHQPRLRRHRLQFLIDEAGHIYEGRHSREYAPGESPTGEDLAGNVVRGVHAQSHTSAPSGSRCSATSRSGSRLRRLAMRLDQPARLEARATRAEPLAKTMYTNPRVGAAQRHLRPPQRVRHGLPGATRSIRPSPSCASAWRTGSRPRPGRRTTRSADRGLVGRDDPHSPTGRAHDRLRVAVR